jgi:hypothetical protein
MALQEALEKVEEYNAAIELPNSGLLGVAAFQASPRETEIAKAELSRCVDLCIAARKTFDGDRRALRENIYLYSALAEIFRTNAERQQLANLLDEIRHSFGILIRLLEGERLTRVPKKKQLDQIAKHLRAMTDEIRRTIPRNTYLAAIGSPIHSGLPIR